MNYLAHAYLSFRIPDILVGNMISDFVKGKKQFEYPESVQEGIRLHRAIDHFTDQHPVTKMAKQFFKPAAGLYAGAFTDVAYDHFLALDEREHDEAGWQAFASEVYQQLAGHQSFLPEHFARMLPYMRSQNWLYNYRFTWGVERSFEGVCRRARYISDFNSVFELFNRHYLSLKQHYDDFFPDVKKFTLSQLHEHLNG